MNKDIVSLVKAHEAPGDFSSYNPSSTDIASYQNRLGVDLPTQYIDFLKTYGQGGIGGVEILGVGRTGCPAFLEATLDYRADGLPDSLIVVENCDEWLYCIDSRTGEVVAWTPGETTVDYPDFDSFLQDQFQEAVDNL